MPALRAHSSGLSISGWLAATVLTALLLAGAAGLSSCNSGEQALTDVDPGAVPLQPSYDRMRTILEKSCVPCHKGGSEGYGDGEDDLDPDLETCEGIQEAIGDVLRVVREDTMPPGAWPRLTEAEKQILFNWLLESEGCSPCTEPCP